jgi:tetratricopeptide (TPR) repeat protein
LKNFVRPLIVALFAAAVVVGASGVVSGAPRGATPAPAATATGTPAPLPTATPEPPEVAIPRLEAKIKANPNDKESLADLSGFYLETGHPDKAFALTQKLLSMGTKTAQIYYFDGVSNQQLGKIKEATADFEQAANLEPTNAQVLLTLTSLYMQTDRAPDAERVAKRATTFNPSDRRSWENYGLVLAQEKKYDEARAAFESSAKLDPKDAGPIVLEARSYIDQSAIALAQQTFDRALTVDPKSVDAILGKARLFAAGHIVKDAIAEYEVLLPLVPSNDAKGAVLVEEFRVYQNEKMSAEAETAIRRAVSAYPAVPGVHLAYGDFMIGNKDQAGAETEWKAALGDKRDNGDALQRLGDLSLAQNKPAQALTYFSRLAELAPNDPNVFAEIGQVESFQHHYDKSRDAYRRAFELSHTPQALAGIGGSDFELKNYKECSVIFDAIDKNAADFLKSNPQFYFVMGKCYAGTNQKDKARASYLRFKPFLKAGSQPAKDLQKTIDDLNAPAAPRPKPTASPKHK